MFRFAHRWLAVPVLGALVLCGYLSQRILAATVSSPSSAAAPKSKGTVVASKGKPVGVELKESFQIHAKEGGTDLSHIPAVVFTSDGNRLVTATARGELIQWNAATRKMIGRVKCDGRPSDGVSLDTRGSRAAWMQDGGGVIVMDAKTGKVIARDAKLGAKWLAMSPDGSMVAVSHNSNVSIYRATSLTKLFTIDEHHAPVTNLVWSKDNRLLASTADDGKLIITDMARHRTAYTIKKSEPLYAASFDPSCKHIAFGGQDRTVYQYDLASGKEDVLSQGQPYWITCLGYSPQGDVIAVGDESCDVWTYEVPTKKLLSHSKHHVECWLNSVAWSPDNETFLFGCRPNSHAGKPSQYGVLNYQEASQCAEVRQVQRKIDLLSDAATTQLGKSEDLKPLRDRMETLLRKRQQRIAVVMGKTDAKSKKAATEVSNRAIADEVLGNGKQYALLLGGGEGQSMIAVDGVGLGGAINGMAQTGEFSLQQQMPMYANMQQGTAVSDQEIKAIDEQIAQLKKELSGKPAMRDIINKMKAMQTERQKRLDSRAKALGASFNINQWKLSRKK